ncbi:MAG: hypothetical protein H8E44_33245 [Planctomycetes bacterium]|nr:hypothetical protein [Planctomycetota bacterium]
MEPRRKTRLAGLAQFPVTGLVDVPPEDRPTALLLFIYAFGSAGGYVTARTVADSLFLSQIGTDKLPAMYMVAAGAVALASILYGSCARRQSLRRIVRWTLASYAVISLALPTLMHQHSGSLVLFAGVYVFAQIRGALGSVQFTTLLNEQFTHGRRGSVFGIVALGATGAGITLGGLVGWLGQRMATEDLMYLAAAMDVIAFLPILFLRSSPIVSAPAAAVPLEYGDQTPDVDETIGGVPSPSLLLIAGLVCLTVLVSTLVEFQWKVAAADELARDEARLTTYFGYFYAIVFLLTGATQLVLTGRIIHRLGVMPTLMVLPLTLAVASVCTLAASAQRIVLWAITFAKGCDVLRRSLNDPGTQLLYFPMPKNVRRQAIAVVFGIVKPSSEALAAVGILAAAPFIAVRQLSYAALLLAIVWLALILWYWITGKRRLGGN